MSVGSNVGNDDGAPDGSSVGKLVGPSVGASVGSDDGDSVGTKVGDANVKVKLLHMTISPKSIVGQKPCTSCFQGMSCALYRRRRILRDIHVIKIFGFL